MPAPTILHILLSHTIGRKRPTGINRRMLPSRFPRIPRWRFRVRDTNVWRGGEKDNTVVASLLNMVIQTITATEIPSNAEAKSLLLILIYRWPCNYINLPNRRKNTYIKRYICWFFRQKINVIVKLVIRIFYS